MGIMVCAQNTGHLTTSSNGGTSVAPKIISAGQNTGVLPS